MTPRLSTRYHKIPLPWFHEHFIYLEKYFTGMCDGHLGLTELINCRCNIPLFILLLNYIKYSSNLKSFSKVDLVSDVLKTCTVIFKNLKLILL